MKFTENSRLGDVLTEHYQILLLLSRFGISLGFGDKTVKAVCADNGVDCKTFLAVCNYVASGDSSLYHNVDIESMVRFLRLAHKYYLEFLLPELRTKLVSIVGSLPDSMFSALVIKLFDSYKEEVRKHLAYEDKVLFDYIQRLLDGEEDLPALSLASFIRQHDNIDTQLFELKNAMIRYFPAGENLREVNQVLYDIFAFEEDLKSHCEIEGDLFIPAVVELEKKRRG
ncbi:MAG: hemerythrin domain-containing protein [Bacteroidales bacterium]|nr:hemerythrin domain-containing protein [Bacteroidales bacterium]